MGERIEWPVIGIDLGTTYSCVAVWRHDRVEIIANDQGNRTTPSIVAFNDSERLIGEAAKNQITINPTNTIFDAKRLIGTRFSDETVQNDIKLWPFKVLVDNASKEEDKPLIKVSYKGEDKRFTPEEISSMVLMKMKDVAEDFLEIPVKNVVVTVPAYFNDSQRQATKAAGTIAGLNVVRIINEPTAAAMAYGLDNMETSSDAPPKTILIFDLGGGTFDVSLVTIDRGELKVRAISGDTHLGGGDFDNRLVQYFLEEFKRKHKKDIGNNPKVLGKLRAASERAKRVLSSAAETTIELDSLFEGIDFSSKINRARFKSLNVDLFKKCMDIVKNCLTDANVKKQDIDEIVLVGGSTRIPDIQLMLQGLFDGKKLCKRVNPDEVVALGAAVHAAILAGVNSSDQTIVFVDVTPLSLSVDNPDGSVAVVIPRNTVIPVTNTCTRVTVHDNQTAVTFRIFEGERPKTTDNTFLGEFSISGFPPKPKRETEFDLCFTVDIDGILHLTAKELGTGLSNQLTITRNARGKFAEEEIEGMLKEAEKYRSDDEEYKTKVEAKNALEAYTYAVSVAWKDPKRFNVGEMVRNLMDYAIKDTQEWLQRNSDCADASEFKKKLRELRSIFGDIASSSSSSS